MVSATAGPVDVVRDGLARAVTVRPAQTPVWGVEECSVVGVDTVCVVSVSALSQELMDQPVRSAPPAQMPAPSKSECVFLFWQG